MGDGARRGFLNHQRRIKQEETRFNENQKISFPNYVNQEHNDGTYRVRKKPYTVARVNHGHLDYDDQGGTSSPESNDWQLHSFSKRDLRIHDHFNHEESVFKAHEIERERTKRTRYLEENGLTRQQLSRVPFRPSQVPSILKGTDVTHREEPIPYHVLKANLRKKDAELLLFDKHQPIVAVAEKQTKSSELTVALSPTKGFKNQSSKERPEETAGVKAPKQNRPNAIFKRPQKVEETEEPAPDTTDYSLTNPDISVHTSRSQRDAENDQPFVKESFIHTKKKTNSRLNRSLSSIIEQEGAIESRLITPTYPASKKDIPFLNK